MQVPHTLINDTILVLRQGQDILHRIHDRMYTIDTLLENTSSIGGHVRHCIDFYTCFLNGAHTGRIDYDNREREELIGTDRTSAATRIEQIIERLGHLDTLDMQAPVLVRMDSNPDADKTTVWSTSSLERELQFLISHTIHHYALIAMLLRMQGFEPGKAFGVAPATLEYWRRIEACVQ